MKTLKPLLFLGLLVALTASFAGTAPAQPQIIQLDCDTLSFDPPRVEVSFAVVNLSPIPTCSVRLTPVVVGPYPACEIFSCSAPNPLWSCEVTAADGGAYWQTSSNCVPTGQKLEVFKFIIDPPYCCYRAEFDGPDGQVYATTLVCFQCESPVPSGQATWGRVKARYH